MWLPGTEKWSSRMPKRSQAAKKASSMGRKQRQARKFQTCRRIRQLT
jgi:hypothetical protein